MQNILIRSYSTRSTLLPQPILDLFVGTLLGDARAEKRYIGGGTTIIFIQSVKHQPYLAHLHSILVNHGYVKVAIKTSIIFNKQQNKQYSFVRFWTPTLKELNFLFELFYLNKSKRVPLNISSLLTPSALAYWAMDDGGKLGSGFQLATHAFSKDEVDLLASVLTQNFDLKTSVYVDRGRPFIYIHAPSLSKLATLIRPYFHDSMLYKITKN
jgi:hypothetical protein